MPAAQPSLTAIILVHYGDVSVTANCLRSLADSAGQAVVIVSNNGTPAQAAQLSAVMEELFGVVRRVDPGEGASPGDRAVLVHNGGNRGFAAGCNSGLRIAVGMPGVDFVWLLNNDTRVEPGSLAALVEEAGACPSAVIGATVVRGDSPDVLQVAGGYRYQSALTRIRPNHAGLPRDLVESAPDLAMDYVYGASMFFSTGLLREVGLLDETFFLFYEELDFCRRAVALGATLRWCRRCVVVHSESAAIGRGRLASVEQKKTAAYHEARSTILFTRKHHPAFIPLVLGVRLIVKPIIQTARGEIRYIPEAVRGAVRGLMCRRSLTD